jgi:hypothetical protein
MSRRNESRSYQGGRHITRPSFVAPGSVLENLYTDGNKYMLIDSTNYANRILDTFVATNYIGYYHVYTTTGAVYTGRRPSALSRRLEAFDLSLFENAPRLDQPNIMSDDNKLYRLLTDRSYNNYILPTLYIPDPEPEVYKRGSFKRYFAQRRTTNEIIEIRSTEFKSKNLTNVIGLSQFSYYCDYINWSVTGTAQQVRDANHRVLARAENDLPGISRYLSDPLEFWRGEDIIDDEYQYTTGGLLRYADGRDYIGFYHILTDGTLKEGVRASSAERATLYRI